MSDHRLRLPNRESARAALGSLDTRAHGDLLDELLDSLWDAYEGDELPESTLILLRDWIAHARFESSPVIRERRAHAGHHS
ncbi:MAG TPA: hypothetical protein VGC11_13500 [Acidimicrobiia bacterium]|jgi:hypothetical protein